MRLGGVINLTGCWKAVYGALVASLLGGYGLGGVVWRCRGCGCVPRGGVGVAGVGVWAGWVARGGGGALGLSLMIIVISKKSFVS